MTQPDVEAAIAFYGGLFDWEFEDVLPPDVPARYVVATLGGLDVASISGPDASAAWATYVAVDDADAVAAAMVDLGATLVAEPEDAGPGGRAATLRDPQGAEIRLWQARRRLGAQLTNSPGAWNFSDLHTTDPAAAQRFYEGALGWRVVDQGWSTAIQVPGYGDHLEATVDPDIRTRQASAPEGFEDVIGGIAAPQDGEASPLARHVHGRRPRRRRRPRRAAGWSGAAVRRERLDPQRPRPRPAGGDVHGQPVRPEGVVGRLRMMSFSSTKVSMR